MAFEAGANIGIADDPMGEPQERRVNPVAFFNSLKCKGTG